METILGKHWRYYHWKYWEREVNFENIFDNMNTNDFFKYVIRSFVVMIIFLQIGRD